MPINSKYRSALKSTSQYVACFFAYGRGLHAISRDELELLSVFMLSASLYNVSVN